ncbi:MAG: hypothetical protein QOF30_3530 [Acidimicrobiaceae bacterium]|jgi:hypothetical protein|nr:hypothetical protein [Acidimicrobiaceae bacterium]
MGGQRGRVAATHAALNDGFSQYSLGGPLRRSCPIMFSPQAGRHAPKRRLGDDNYAPIPTARFQQDRTPPPRRVIVRRGREAQCRGPMSNPRLPGGVVHELPADLLKALIANPTALDVWKDIRLWLATSSSAGSRMPSRRTFTVTLGDRAQHLSAPDPVHVCVRREPHAS